MRRMATRDTETPLGGNPFAIETARLGTYPVDDQPLASTRGPGAPDESALPTTELVVTLGSSLFKVEEVAPAQAPEPAQAREADRPADPPTTSTGFEPAYAGKSGATWIRSRRAAVVFTVSAVGGLAAGWYVSNRSTGEGTTAIEPVATEPQPIEFAAPTDRAGDQGVAIRLGGSDLRPAELAAPEVGAGDQGVAIRLGASDSPPTESAAAGDAGEAGPLTFDVGPPRAQADRPAELSLDPIVAPNGPTITPLVTDLVTDLRPPATAPAETSLSDRPSLTPSDTPPALLNERQVQALIRQYHPRILEDVGLGGSVEMWIYVDESGAVARHEVKTSSGNSLLDAAAARVVNQMRFSPATIGDRATPVWVQQQLVFPANP